jgi:hypothetical protein
MYRDLLSAWVIDEADRGARDRVEAAGLRVAVTDTLMTGDAAAERVARAALALV